MTRRFLRVALAAGAAALALAGGAQAAGGTYVFDGGTAKQQRTVRAALNASTFDWGLVPATVTIHIRRGGDSYSLPGHIYLDGDLLDSGRFAWGTVQHEYAHEVDFFLLDPAKRERLNAALGGRDWCYGVSGLAHSEYGCERFASTLAWTYWQSPDNAYRPESRRDESAAMAPAAFRTLLGDLLGPHVSATRALSRR